MNAAQSSMVPRGHGSFFDRWRKQIFASLLSRGNGRHEAAVGARKEQLFDSVRGTVVEIGPGAGNNLSYLSPLVRWIGIEPNPFVHAHLLERADRLGLSAEVRLAHADATQLPSGSVDAVIGTLVLCSVDDVDETLAEVKRILRPGGRFVFLEHVAAPEGTWRRSAQRMLNPLQSFFGDGCRLDRETWKSIAAAGFARAEIEHFELPLLLGGTHIAGVAIKAGRRQLR